MGLIRKRCIPCEGGYCTALSAKEEDSYLKEINDWKIDRSEIHKILKEYKLLHFMDSINFVNQIAKISEDEGHHPNIKIEFTIVSLEIYTHAIKGLSENDFILAAKIDEVYEEEFKL